MIPIQVTFTLDEASYAKVSEYLVSQSYRQKSWVLYGIGAILLLLTFTALLSGRWLILLAFLLPTIGFLVLMRRLVKRTIKKAYDDQPELNDPIQFTFSPDEIYFKTAGGEALLPWDAFQRVVETDHFFLLYHTDTKANPVLKSGFQSTEEIDQLRELFQQKKLL